MTTWRMLGIVMQLALAAGTGIGHVLLNLLLALALLLAAMLAPTVPVSAAWFGTGPAGHGEEGETKLALTSEAGLKDGLAFRS